MGTRRLSILYSFLLKDSRLNMAQRAFGNALHLVEREFMDQKKRVAILIASRRDPFFDALKAKFNRKSYLESGNFSYEVFFVEGKLLSSLERKIRDHIERLRYTKLWPFLWAFDSIFLRPGNQLPAAHLVESESKVIQVDTKDDLRHLALKMYSAFQYCVEQQFDFVVRTTLSSIINLDELGRYLDGIEDSDRLYAGKELKLPQTSPVASGSFTVFARKTLEHLLSNIDRHQPGFLDDVSVGKILIKDFDFSPLSSYDLARFGEMKMIPKKEIHSIMHFRCKSDARPRRDLEILEEVSKALNAAGIQYV